MTLAGCIGGGGDGNGGDGNGDGDDTPTSNDTDDNGTDNGTDSGGDGEPLRNTLTLPSIRGDSLNDTIFNPIHPSQSIRYFTRLLWPLMMTYSQPDQEWIPLTAAEWDVPDTLEAGSEATVTLQEDMYWHNGDPVTAEHAVNHMRLSILDDPSIFSYVDSYEQVDDLTFSLTFSETISRDVFLDELSLFGANECVLTLGGPQFQQFHDRLEDASTEEEEEEILIEATEFTMDEPVGFGPWEVSEITSAYIEFDRFDDWPVADFNFDHLRIQEVADGYRSATAAQEIDRAINQQFFYEDEVQYQASEVREYGGGQGHGICFDMRRDDLYFDNRRVRQAIAYAVSRRDIAQDMAPQTDNRDEIADIMYTRTVSGFPDDSAEQYLGEDFIDQLPNYDPEELNFDRAGEILRDEGFTKDGEWWNTPDGDRWSFDYISYSEWEWHDVPQSIVGQLRSFGIDVEQRVVESGEYWGQAFDDSEFAMKGSNWGNTPIQSPLHPVKAADRNLTFEAYMARQIHTQYDNAGEWSYDPLYFEVPMPVGDMEGNVEEVDLTEVVQNLQRTSDPDRIQELSQEIAWIKANFLDTIPVYTFLRNGLYNTEHWDWMEQGHAHDNTLNNQTWADIPHGSVQAKTE